MKRHKVDYSLNIGNRIEISARIKHKTSVGKAWIIRYFRIGQFAVGLQKHLAKSLHTVKQPRFGFCIYENTAVFTFYGVALIMINRIVNFKNYCFFLARILLYAHLFVKSFAYKGYEHISKGARRNRCASMECKAFSFAVCKNTDRLRNYIVHPCYPPEYNNTDTFYHKFFRTTIYNSIK